MVECLRRGWLCRKLRLFVRIVAEIEWDASGPIERIRICGETAISLCPFWYAPRFDFLLQSDDCRIPARIEVRLTRFLPIALRAFRLLVEQRVVYEEGRWPVARAPQTLATASARNVLASQPR